jgi:hypothetical protein
MKVAWFSAGVSSFIACYIAKDVDKIIYIHIDDQHEDTMRFLKDCEKLLGKEIEILQSRYKTVDEVVKQFKYINGVGGATCTKILKKRVRKEWEEQFKDKKITYIWGFDLEEINRAERIIDSMPNFKHEFPLIDAQLKKNDVHAISNRLGLVRPKMYDLGYRNNNCIGCVKGGMGYWNKIRIDFPEIFESRAKLERLIGASCINGVYLDELDQNRGRFEDEIQEDCNIMCQLQINEYV